MGDFRARDADRDLAVDVIEAAYVDGQLGDADRELRVSRALSAETIGELEGLTRDLQVRTGQGLVRPDTPPTPVPAPSRTSSRTSSRTRVWVALAGAAVVGVVGLVPLLLLAPSGPSSSSDTSVSVTRVDVPSAEESAPGFEMTVGQVRSFLKGYERRFGTSEAFGVAFFPDRVRVQVPVPGSRPRMERWTWDGQWRQDTTASAVGGLDQRVDVGSIDVRRMFANITVARRTLGVQDPRFTHATLVRRGDGPTELDLYVSNDANESAHLSTSPAGEVRRSHPYAP